MDKDIKKLTFSKDYNDIVTKEELIEAINSLKGFAEKLNMIPTDLEGTTEYKEEIKNVIENIEATGRIQEFTKLPKTCYPDEYISGTARVNNLLFEGKLNEQLQLIGTESRGNKELTVKASIDFEGLEGVKLSNRNINSYDREVHDSIVSLYVDGENKYITPLMVYRTMTGNPQAKFSKSGKNFKDITDSIEKCSQTRVYIDATEEAQAKGYDIDQPIFKENLIYTRSISGFHNGELSEWIEILSTPILYKYANSKNQVARMDIKLLNTPINKNEENIILQGYLRKRIQAMKGSRINKNIRYDTTFKQLNIKSASDGALRKKHSKLRSTIKEILNYWKDEGFIKNYKENIGAKNSRESITIIL